MLTLIANSEDARPNLATTIERIEMLIKTVEQDAELSEHKHDNEKQHDEDQSARGYTRQQHLAKVCLRIALVPQQSPTTCETLSGIHHIVLTTHVPVSIRECRQHHHANYGREENCACSVCERHWDHEETEHR